MGTRTTTGLGAVLLGLLVAGCGGGDAQMAAVQTPAASATAAEPPPLASAAAPASKPSMLETQLAFAKSYVTSLCEPETFLAFYAPEAVLWNVGDPEVKGREAIRTLMLGIVDAVGGCKASASRIWTQGNTLVLEYVTAATDKASGKPTSMSACEIFTFNDDGLIATDRTYSNAEIFLKQTGAYHGQKPAPPLLPLPSGPVEMHAAKNDATEQTNLASVAATHDAWFKKDDRTFLGFLDDGLTSYDMSENGTTPHDKKFQIAGMAAGRKAIDFTAYKDTNVLAVEDFTIDESESTLTQKAAYSFDKIHVPNTRKSATTHGVEIDQWKDGKIVKSWSWSNGMELDKQLGIGPAAPAKPAAKATAKNGSL